MQVTRVAPGWPVPSLMHRRRVMADRITYVGLDVHKESIVVAVAAGGLRGEVRGYGRVANTATALDRLMRSLRGRGAKVRVSLRRGARRVGHYPPPSQPPPPIPPPHPPPSPHPSAA